MCKTNTSTCVSSDWVVSRWAHFFRFCFELPACLAVFGWIVLRWGARHNAWRPLVLFGPLESGERNRAYSAIYHLPFAPLQSYAGSAFNNNNMAMLGVYAANTPASASVDAY
eukprot:TRINITY_DN8403_c0_g1_i1.p1 TRINITY_DN8403_c0_g1~~TRINITY_DN8403_c0_g1_i1.p1  ORF type:complete len:112 (-),score=10.56 TRINITY_DN8403_c0_g1_i1:12-347(-)